MALAVRLDALTVFTSSLNELPTPTETVFPRPHIVAVLIPLVPRFQVLISLISSKQKPESYHSLCFCIETTLVNMAPASKKKTKLPAGLEENLAAWWEQHPQLYDLSHPQ